MFVPSLICIRREMHHSLTPCSCAGALCWACSIPLVKYMYGRNVGACDDMHQLASGISFMKTVPVGCCKTGLLLVFILLLPLWWSLVHAMGIHCVHFMPSWMCVGWDKDNSLTLVSVRFGEHCVCDKLSL